MDSNPVRIPSLMDNPRLTKRSTRRVPSASDENNTTEEPERDRQQKHRTRKGSYWTPPSKQNERSWMKTTFDSATKALCTGVYDALAWVVEVVGLVIHIVKKTLAYLVAVYLALVGCTILARTIIHSLHSTFASPCEIPGVSWFNFTCPTSPSSSPLCHVVGLQELVPSWCRAPPSSTANEPEPMISKVEELVRLHETAGHILQASVDVATLPREMQQSDSVIRLLENLIRYSQLQRRDELLEALNEYIRISDDTTDGLVDFFIGCDSLTSGIIIVNRWTILQLGDMEKLQMAFDKSWVPTVISKIIVPSLYNEQKLAAHYAKHIAEVIRDVDISIERAEVVLGLLKDGKKHLSNINRLAIMEMKNVENDQRPVLQRFWTRIVGDHDTGKKRPKELILLGMVDGQRKESIELVEKITVQLKDTRGSLHRLQRKIETSPHRTIFQTQFPLSVHISILNESVISLEAARAWTFAEKRDRVRAVHERLNGPEPFIKAK